MTFRGFLYRAARSKGDYDAVRRGRIGARVYNRAVGRVLGRIGRRLYR